MSDVEPPVSTFVKFSRVRGGLWDRIAAAHEAMQPWNVTPRQFVTLVPAAPSRDGGLVTSGPPRACHSVREAEALSKGVSAFALVYLARDAGSLFTLFFFALEADQFSVSLDLGTRMVSFAAKDQEPGRWVEGLLVAITRALQAGMCSYGDYEAGELDHAALDERPRIAALERGSFEGAAVARPSFQAVSNMSVLAGASRLATMSIQAEARYRLSGRYHLFGSIAPEGDGRPGDPSAA